MVVPQRGQRHPKETEGSLIRPSNLHSGHAPCAWRIDIDTCPRFDARGPSNTQTRHIVSTWRFNLHCPSNLNNVAATQADALLMLCFDLFQTLYSPSLNVGVDGRMAVRAQENEIAVLISLVKR
jgi:hypothetical protein